VEYDTWGRIVPLDVLAAEVVMKREALRSCSGWELTDGRPDHRRVANGAAALPE
jgi:hypothetical protein